MIDSRRFKAMLGFTCGALAAIAAALALLVGGGSAAQARSQAPPPKLHALGSCDALRGYLVRHRVALTPPVMAMEDSGVAGMAAAADPAAASPGAATSPTNVQEAGVDEPDIVKTAGSTIFTVDGNRLRAVSTQEDTPRLLGSMRLPSGPGPDGSILDYRLVVAGDRLLAIGSGYDYAYPVATGAELAPDVVMPSAPRVVLAEVSIAEPAAMRVERTMTVDGSYVDARLTGSTVRLVSTDAPPVAIPKRGQGRALVPRMRLRDRVSGERSTGMLTGCDQVRRPSRFAGAGTLSVLTIDLERGLPAVDVDSVLTDGQVVYASPTSLYVATERWQPSPAADASSEVDTEIHRFDISDPDATAYVASGRVGGYMLSQWSMSEQDGLLRVASTTSPPLSEDGTAAAEGESEITVLAADGDRLRAVGRVDGIGRGEDIYAVRFIGDLGYVVTFRQIDPLHVIDLSDPTDPRLAGELKIPGYSAYLHPVGPGLLLGVGREVSAGGVPGGVEASLFDVSDAAAPVRLDVERFGGASSTEIEYDHHAFSFFAGDSLAMIPLDAYTPTGGEASSAAGLRVSPGSDNPLGRVARVARPGGYDGQIRRTLELGGRVYAIAANGISAYEPATLAPLGALNY